MKEIVMLTAGLTAGTIITSHDRPPPPQRLAGWSTLSYRQAKEKGKRREQRRQAKRSQRRNRV